jgi:pimeloyl-ACP methyl ester carboxylesterase
LPLAATKLEPKEISMSEPTVVLVHGAFADASSWRGVFEALESDRRKVLAPPNPLRGLATDAEYISAITTSIDGPVLLVGHSYGGALITVAGVAENVVGLVYVAGFAPDVGEALGPLQARFPASPAAAHFVPADTPQGVEVSIDPAAFPEVFAADVDPGDAAFMAIAQRPISARALEEPAGAAAWMTKPSWAVLPEQDGAIHPGLHRFAYERAGAMTTSVPGASHVVMISQPGLVAGVVNEALMAVPAQA